MKELIGALLASIVLVACASRQPIAAPVADTQPILTQTTISGIIGKNTEIQTTKLEDINFDFHASCKKQQCMYADQFAFISPNTLANTLAVYYRVKDKRLHLVLRTPKQAKIKNASHLTLLIDTQISNLEHVKAELAAFIHSLPPQYQISIFSLSNDAPMIAFAEPVSRFPYAKIDSIKSSFAPLNHAVLYKLLDAHFDLNPKRENHVLLFSDGQFKAQTSTLKKFMPKANTISIFSQNAEQQYQQLKVLAQQYNARWQSYEAHTLASELANWQSNHPVLDNHVSISFSSGQTFKQIERDAFTGNSDQFKQQRLYANGEIHLLFEFEQTPNLENFTLTIQGEDVIELQSKDWQELPKDYFD